MRRGGNERVGVSEGGKKTVLEQHTVSKYTHKHTHLIADSVGHTTFKHQALIMEWAWL